MSAPAINMFISSAKADVNYYERLQTALASVKRTLSVATWSEHDLTAGTPIFDIDERLKQSDLIVFLVTNNYLKEDYRIVHELPTILKNNPRRAIPILVEPCDWKYEDFRHLTFLPKNRRPITKWENPDDAWLKVSEGIREKIAELMH